MQTVRLLPLVVLAFVLGCSTAPKLRHSQVAVTVDGNVTLTAVEALAAVTYHSTGSMLHIDQVLDPQGAPTARLSVASIPVAADRRIYRVEGKQGNFEWTRTFIGVQYVPNTRILQTLGVQVKDDRKQVFTALGRLAAALAGGGAATLSAVPPAANKQLLPITVDSIIHLKSANRGETSAIPFDCPGGTVCGEVTYGALPDDALSRSDFIAAVNNAWTDLFPVPACRSAKISMQQWNPKSGYDAAAPRIILVSVVSDPAYVRVVRLPPTGTINFHSACGADVVLGDITVDPIWAAIAELGAQVQANNAARAAEMARDDKPQYDGNPK
jgi:hypothetical protein